MTNLTLTPTKRGTTCMMTHEQIQQKFNEESDDDEFLHFESIVLILVCLIVIHRFDSGGGWLVLETGASYTRVQLIHKYIL